MCVKSRVERWFRGPGVHENRALNVRTPALEWTVGGRRVSRARLRIAAWGKVGGCYYGG